MILCFGAILFLLICTPVLAINRVSSFDKKREDEEQINFIKNCPQKRRK